MPTVHICGIICNRAWVLALTTLGMATRCVSERYGVHTMTTPAGKVFYVLIGHIHPSAPLMAAMSPDTVRRWDEVCTIITTLATLTTAELDGTQIRDIVDARVDGRVVTRRARAEKICATYPDLKKESIAGIHLERDSVHSRICTFLALDSSTAALRGLLVLVDTTDIDPLEIIKEWTPRRFTTIAGDGFFAAWKAQSETFLTDVRVLVAEWTLPKFTTISCDGFFSAWQANPETFVTNVRVLVAEWTLPKFTTISCDGFFSAWQARPTTFLTDVKALIAEWTLPAFTTISRDSFYSAWQAWPTTFLTDVKALIAEWTIPRFQAISCNGFFAAWQAWPTTFITDVKALVEEWTIPRFQAISCGGFFAAWQAQPTTFITDVKGLIKAWSLPTFCTISCNSFFSAYFHRCPTTRTCVRDYLAQFHKKYGRVDALSRGGVWSRIRTSVPFRAALLALWSYAEHWPAVAMKVTRNDLLMQNLVGTEYSKWIQGTIKNLPPSEWINVLGGSYKTSKRKRKRECENN